jgi:hypothetical protein
VGERTKPRKGAVFRCGLRVERQLNAAVNLYLQMEGLPHDPEWFDKVVGGFALTGEEADEGSNEPWRSPRLLNPKSYICLPKTHSSEPLLNLYYLDGFINCLNCNVSCQV